jgi:hypothetical protein
MIVSSFLRANFNCGWRSLFAQFVPTVHPSLISYSPPLCTAHRTISNLASLPDSTSVLVPFGLIPQNECARHARNMSTGGVSRKEYLWAIREEQNKQAYEDKDTSQRKPEEGTEDIPLSTLLNNAGYANVQDALQRVLIGAYQLLQDGQVDQAGYLVAEGRPSTSTFH